MKLLNYQRNLLLFDLPLSFMTEADVGDPGQGGHGVLISDVGEHDPVKVVPGHWVTEQEGHKLAG